MQFIEKLMIPLTLQWFQDILRNLQGANNEDNDKNDKGKVLYVMFGNIHNIMLSKRTLFFVKIFLGKNLHFRYSRIIFQTHHMMIEHMNIPLWIVSNVSSGMNLLASGETFQKIRLQIFYLKVAQKYHTFV